jgi:biotin transport system substrate-specific component
MSVREQALEQVGWTSRERAVLKSVGAALFAFLTILGAHIRIPLPFTPVPMTLQTLFVPLAGAVLGAYWGTASMLLYLVLGAFGLDAFAGSSGGASFVFAPTAGYLVGFVLSSAAVGWITTRNPSKRIALLSLALGHLIIFTCGVAGLMVNGHLALSEAFAKGVLPFLVGDSLKILVSFLFLLSYRTVRKTLGL